MALNIEETDFARDIRYSRLISALQPEVEVDSSSKERERPAWLIALSLPLLMDARRATAGSHGHFDGVMPNIWRTSIINRPVRADLKRAFFDRHRSAMSATGSCLAVTSVLHHASARTSKDVSESKKVPDHGRQSLAPEVVEVDCRWTESSALKQHLRKLPQVLPKRDSRGAFLLRFMTLITCRQICTCHQTD